MKKVLELKVGELDFIINFLDSIGLIGDATRMRSRFVRMLKVDYQQFLEERQELIERYGKRDEQGQLIVETKEDGSSFYPIENRDEFNKELSEILDEEVTYVFDNKNNKILQSVIKTVFNYKDKSGEGLKGLKADLYDELCLKLEPLSDEEILSDEN